MTFILSVPVQIYAGGSEEQGQDPVTQEPMAPQPDEGVSDNILTEDEVREMGVDLPPDATRSTPWNQWERIGYPGSGEMPAIAFNSTSGKLYTYGGGSIQTGFGVSYSSTRDQFYYNFNTNRWVHFEKAVSPGDRFQASVAVDEGRGKMYVYGGNQGGAVLNDLWEFDMGTETWKRLDSSMLPSGRAQAPMVLDPTVGDKGVLYLHMGVDTSLDNITDFYKIDLANLGAAPVALNDGVSSGLLKRTDHDMCIDVNNKLIYLFGGRHKVNDNSYDYYTEFWVYNIVADAWIKLVNPPEFGTKLFYGAKMFYRSADNTVNIWGGRDATSGTSMNRTLWSYNTQTTLWSFKHFLSGNSPVQKAFYGRYYSAASDTYFIFQGRYYTTGGGGGASATRRSDVAFLDPSAKSWTIVPGNISASSVSAGIFAHNKAQDRIYYIGPSINWGSPWGNGSAYVYYFDLKLKDWKGPFYNPSGTNPDRGGSGRSNMGICYVPSTNEVFLYGGGGVNQGGGGAPPTYYDFADMWKLSLSTYSWTKLHDPAGPGERQGFQMVYNSKDGMIYFYGGYNHPDETSAIVIYEDFYKFNPLSAMFTEITLAGTHPGARYGTSLLYEPDDNLLYLFGGFYLKTGQTNPQEKNDLFTYNFTTELWSEVDTTMNPSSRSYAKMVYDPLTRDIILTGGSLNNDLLRYRILEGKWYIDSLITVNPGSLENHAVLFIEETRDLYLFGGGARSGMWRFGVPQRLGIQKMSLVDPDGAGTVYAMYRPYHFRSTVKAINDVSEIAEVRFIFQHKDGVFSVVYNHTLGQWSEVDALDRAFLTDHSASENGLFLTIDFYVKFNWTWVQKSNLIDRSVTVRAKGKIAPDELIVKSFLTVKNVLELRGVLKTESSIQGPIQNGSWVRAGETLNLHGIVVAYQGAKVYPPLDSYKLVLWDEDNKQIYCDYEPGQEFNFTMDAPNTTMTDIAYKINITGVPPESDTSKLGFRYSADADPPSTPGQVLIFDQATSERTTLYDNDPSVYVTWSASEDSASGVDHYYWSLDDNGGTRFGTPADLSSDTFEVNLSKKGSYRIFVWAEDKVGNIGQATNATILIDTDPISFRVLNPDLKVIMPYRETNFIINLTDVGGSGITTQTIKYRFTNNGITDLNQWLGSGSWKWVDNKYQIPGQQEFMEIEIPLKTLTNGYDNFIQMQAMDGSGTLCHSPIYTLLVDEDLRFPIAEIMGPSNGTIYDKPEDVLLSWNVTFYDPSDVSYKIFMSQNKNDVMLKRTSALFTTVYDGLSLIPPGLDYGTYYWTVEPWAQGKYQGSCRNGVFWFTLSNEASYAFEASARDTTKTKLEQGGSTFFMFTLKNTGQKDLSIIPSVKLEGVGNVTDIISYQWLGLNKTNKYGVVVRTALDINFEIKQVRENAPIGNYTLNFTFVNQYGIKVSVLLELQIVAKQVKIDGDPDPVDLGPFIVAGIIVVLLVMIIIGGLYFFLVKKKTKDTHRDIESELDAMEGDIGIGGTGLKMAPQPKGLKTGSLASQPKKDSKKGAEEEDEDGVMEWEDAPMLAEEGSEDDWMNLVATETFSEVKKSETVEEDMSVGTDKEKSLKDLLFEMSDKDK